MVQNRSVRIGILHVQIFTGDTRYNHKVLGQAISIAAGYDCEAVLTGELIECGAQFWRNIELLSIPGKIYPYLNHLQEIAYKYKMHILMGRAERDLETGILYSNYSHINQKGELAAECRKQMIENLEENRYLSQGRELVYTQICGLKAALFVGFNDEILRLMEHCKNQGTDLIICAVAPTYHSYLREEVSHISTRIQPIIFCSYNCLSDHEIYTGESIYLNKGKGCIFRPGCSSVIVVDYNIDSKSFQLVRSVNINELMQ